MPLMRIDKVFNVSNEYWTKSAFNNIAKAFLRMVAVEHAVFLVIVIA